MDYTEAIDASVSINNFLEYFYSFSLWNGPSAFDYPREIASVTKLCDEACMRFESYYLVEFNYVLKIA